MPTTKIDAWLGIDSCNGRYLFGSDDTARGDGLIPPQQSAQIQTSSQVPFRGERLFVRRECASDFLIRGVFVGNEVAGAVTHYAPVIAEPFVVDFDELPLLRLDEDKSPELFDGKRAVRIKVEKGAKEFWGAPFPLPVLQPGLHLTFQIENIGTAPRRFLAAFLGTAIW